MNGTHANKRAEHAHLNAELFPADWVVCPRCRLIHHQRTPCSCEANPLLMEGEPACRRVRGWFIGYCLLLMGAGLVAWLLGR